MSFNASAAIVTRYTCETEVSGDTPDVVGSNNLRLDGDTAVVTDAERGNVLNCLGDGGYIKNSYGTDSWLGQLLTQSNTIMMWFKFDSWGTTAWSPNLLWRGNYTIGRRSTTSTLRWNVYQSDATNLQVTYSSPDVADGEWHHVAAVTDTTSNSIAIYIDGVKLGEEALTSTPALTNNNSYMAISGFVGKIDDVIFFNEALDAAAIQSYMVPEPASNPSPSDTSTDIAVNADLSWTVGSGALSHDVYFGTIQSAVENAQRLAGDINGDGTVDIDDLKELAFRWLSSANLEDFATLAADWGLDAVVEFQGNQTSTTFDPGTLDEGVTYYWRIDEVNAYGTTTGDVWSFTTVPELAITNISPSNYTIHYDSLTAGQTVYIDRAYTYTSVPSAYQGKTYIRTANNDKGDTTPSFLTFDVTQDVTVYVAYDNGEPKPSWLSTYYADTGVNITSNGPETYRLWSKDFKAGTVSLGGNGDTNGSGSMYTVIVVGKGTVTPPDPGLSSDFYSDTWVAVDALGRALPDYDDCGPPRSDRYVAMMYNMWHGEHGTDGPYDVTKILAADPYNPAWGPGGEYPNGGAPHHWGEPELGYYLSDDQWVMRKHAYMLANADVDVIIFDITNAFTYIDNHMTLLSVFANIRANGGTTPQIAFMANARADEAIEGVPGGVYTNIYGPGLYSDLWFYWKGKPLILAPLEGMVINGRTINYSSTVRNFFNFRYAWADVAGSGSSGTEDIWDWIDNYPQDYGWHDGYPEIPEEIAVAAGRHANMGHGRSYHNGSQPYFDPLYALTGTEDQGFFFDEQWSRLNQLDPELVFICSWNEWTQQRFIVPAGQQFWFLGELVGAGSTFFVDQYNQEFSRDIEPMVGGHTDNYYYQLIDGIRRYKGVRPLPAASAAKTVAIDGNFSDWVDVGPDYRDWLGDTMHRNTTGWGSAGTYINTTGRNDFLAAKVARDDTYVYFYIRTDVNITSYTDSNWMMLFINSDQNYSTGWEGYDYVVNMGVNSSTSTTLKYTSGGWNWTNVNTNIAYRVSGNQIEIRVPRSDIGQGSGSDTVAFDFKWSDNIQNNNDIIEFAISGDSAPDRRFNYRYDTSITNTIDVTNPSFESPNVSGYQYQPSGSGWDYAGGGFIIADSGSAFGNTAYQGSQNLVLQQAVSVWQDVSGFEVGKTYQVAWAEADRPGSFGENTLRVLIDSNVVGALHTVTNDSWVLQTSSTFTATSTTHTLEFETTNAQGGDRSVFIDAVSITEVP